MFLIPNEAWSALLGALVGAWITYRFASILADRQFEHLKVIAKLDSRHIAAGNFIAELAPDLEAIERGSICGDLVQYLASLHKRHADAVAVFSHHLEEPQRKAFLADWQRYCYGDDDSGNPASGQTYSLPDEDVRFFVYSEEMHAQSEARPRELAAKRIHRLLSYAKET